MANNRNYQIKIGFSTDNTTLAQLEKNLKAIIELAKQPGNELNKELQEASKMAQQLSNITKDSFNSKTNTLNIAKMNKELAKSGQSLTTVYNTFSKIGVEGANVYNTIAASVMKANFQIKQSNKLLDSFAVSMANTVKWGITSGLWNTVTNSLSALITPLRPVTV